MDNSKIVDFLLERGETREYAEDALQVMIDCVMNQESLVDVLKEAGVPYTKEYVDELFEYVDEAVNF